jgi:hypothetical protein
MKGILCIVILFLQCCLYANAQVTSTSGTLVAQPVPDRTVSFDVSDLGVAKPITWGLDAAWPNEGHIRRGIAFMGADRVDLMRASFQPTHPLVNGDLQQEQIDWVNFRISLVNLIGPHAKLTLNCDHPSVDPWYAGNAERWAQLVDVTARRFQEAGRTIVTIGPFNEPDYGWGQGSNQDFFNIVSLLKQNSRFDNSRIAGGNTLNCDQALNWYNYLKPAGISEGNTHQLAGTFDNFAAFYQAVSSNGDHATGDELHNVMEAMVGVEYGMQTGIWWATAELARGEFVKASDGVRLGYAEHRPNWTAASVYRSVEGKVQAFGGTSERQAITTTYRFLSTERDVYYDGYGPQREYTMVMPGGTGYGQGQTNAERVVNITWGDDIQPVINGRYMLVNRGSGKVLEVPDGSTNNGVSLRLSPNTGAAYQQWNITPLDSRAGGDFSYFKLTAAHSGKAADIYNFSLENGGSIVAWDDVNGGNQHWYFDYDSDGWFYIRSRYSAKCLDVSGDGVTMVHWDKANDKTSQQWRLLPIDASVEFNVPASPVNLVATANAESIRLTWSASPEADVSGYTIFRAGSAGGPYNTIARNVKTTSFTDNTATTGDQYFYVIRAVDKSLNRSDYSNEVSAIATGSHDLVTHLKFDGNSLDSTINGNHSALFTGTSYVTGKVGTKALALNGTTFAQLPTHLANQQEISIATWVYWNGGNAWQRIFDFGNGESENMFLTPSSGAGQLQFAIKNGGDEQVLTASELPKFKWTHVAITLGTSGAALYVNGVKVAESNTINISPLDFKPVLNYIGRSQYADPLLKGNVDDFRVYNYPLSTDEVAQLAGVVPDTDPVTDVLELDGLDLSVWPIPADTILETNYSTECNDMSLVVYNANGKLVMSKKLSRADDAALDVSNLPSGLYMLKLRDGNKVWVRKVVVKH